MAKAKTKGKKALGRPSAYTPAKARAICKLLATGMTLRQVCRLDGMPPPATVREWALDDREGFSAQYAHARELGWQAMADDIVDIADDGSRDWTVRYDSKGNEYQAVDREVVERSKLRFEARRWLLSKALPKMYGDKLDLKHDIDDFREVWAGLASAAQAAA